MNDQTDTKTGWLGNETLENIRANVLSAHVRTFSAERDEARHENETAA